MNNFELIKQHDEGTMICSLPTHMRSASPTYNEIMSKGNDIVPDILGYLKENKGGMSVMLLLWDILEISPYQPEQKDGFAAFKVSDARQSWINWGIKEKLI